jgi:hypothetical protein
LEDLLHFQLDSLLDIDLCTCCKNCKIKDIMEGAVNASGMKASKAHLAMWITEIHKLAEECIYDTKALSQGK